MKKRSLFRLLCAALALLLCAGILIPAVLGDEDDNIESDKPATVLGFDRALDSRKSAHQVNPGSVYGMHLHLGAPFDGLSYCLPTWGSKDSSCVLALYLWNENYDATVEQEPICSKLFENVQDCKTYKLPCDDLPAGEYFFAIRDVTGTIGTWLYPAALTKGYIYDSGLESQGDLEITVNFTKTPKEPFFAVKAATDVDGDHTAPAEYVIPEDSLMYTHEVMPDTWVFTDGLGRVSLTNADVGDPREDRTLALFYWTWHGDLGTNEPFNVNDFILQYPEAKNDYKHKAWPKSGVAYFWNEPVYGYYRTFDEWVLRRQGELLANAGVDVIFTDNTNGAFTWRNGYTRLYETWDKAQKDGVDVPKISYLLPFGPNDGSKEQIQNIYLDIYRPGKYQNLWYYFDGKPMLMGFNSNFNRSTPLGKEILSFFTFRSGQAAYLVDKTSYGTWGWLSAYPQALYYATRSDYKNNNVEQMTVGVSVNYSWTQKACTAMNGTDITGRSYTTSGYHTEPDASLWGYHFAEQFDYALSVDPRVLFVTGWNEWTAGRSESWGGVENAFPDEFNDEYSRDLEPTRGALRDNYYYQFVNYVRRYKGVRPIPEPSLAVSVDVNAGAEQWAQVLPYYAAYIGNTGDRDADGYGSTHYADASGRNDIIGAKVARDDEFVYFLCECAEDITPYTDPLWMTLYIDCDQDNQGWESFDFVINKTAPSATTAVLERFTGTGYASEKVADVTYTVNGKYLQIAVPKSALGLSGFDFTINFSWTDNVHDVSDTGDKADGKTVYHTFSGDIMDFYTSGDVAPAGRFKFSYISTLENALGAQAATDTVVTDPETAEPASDTTNAESDTEVTEDEGCASMLSLPCLLLPLIAFCALRKRKEN
ncbi:MAG: hypothetical protein MJ192_04170 [Clostridia bacterium]|nr:hypothetical protein [Clostridia bacterium]